MSVVRTQMTAPVNPTDAACAAGGGVVKARRGACDPSGRPGLLYVRRWLSSRLRSLLKQAALALKQRSLLSLQAVLAP